MDNFGKIYKGTFFQSCPEKFPKLSGTRSKVVIFPNLSISKVVHSKGGTIAKFCISFSDISDIRGQPSQRWHGQRWHGQRWHDYDNDGMAPANDGMKFGQRWHG